MSFNLVVPTYTASRLERMALSLLKGRLKGSMTVPVDIDYILEQEPGVYCAKKSAYKTLAPQHIH